MSNKTKRIGIVIFAFIFAFIFLFPLFGSAEEAQTQTVSQPRVMIDLTGIVISIIGLIFNFLLAWFARKVVPPLKAWLDVRTTTEQRAAIETFVRQAVEAAEQIIGAGAGTKKFDYVANAMRNAGYTVDRNLIEAAVKEMNDRMIGTFSPITDDVQEDFQE